MNIYCCSCEDEIEARLTNGIEIYPHRSDLAKLPFWKCDCCNNFVGCHHKKKTELNHLDAYQLLKSKSIDRHCMGLSIQYGKMGE